MRKFVLSAALITAGLMTVPASAQAWRIQPSIQRQIQGDIDQLQTQIQRAAQRRTISPREATSLRRTALNVQQTYRRFNRGGLNRVEVTELENRINTVRQQLRLDRRDWDGRRS